jgi:hypothetical protein
MMAFIIQDFTMTLSQSYSLGIEYSSYSISKLLQVFASENVFRAQVLGSIPEQLEEVYQTR